MIVLALSAVLVGAIHSLAPSHWLPVVLLSRSRQWSPSRTFVGALVVGFGHVLTSVSLGIAAVAVGIRFMGDHAERVEHGMGVFLFAFGLIYAAVAYYRHASCHGHGHHGPVLRSDRAPFLFLFTLGLAPCAAVVPLFVAAESAGIAGVATSMFA